MNMLVIVENNGGELDRKLVRQGESVLAAIGEMMGHDIWHHGDVIRIEEVEPPFEPDTRIVWEDA